MTSIRVGMCQTLVENGRLEENLARAAEAASVAAGQGADIVVLPETLDLGWIDQSTRSRAEPIPGPRTDFFRQVAIDNNVLLACGLSERAIVDGSTRLYNAAVLISRSGEILLHHRKINELTSARALYSTGTSLGVADTELGLIGLNICADNFAAAAAIGQAQGLMGAQLIVSPSAWALDPELDVPGGAAGQQWIDDTWIRPYRQLAMEFDLAVVGVSNVGGQIVGGDLDGRVGIGGSVAVDRSGDVLERAPYGSGAASTRTINVEIRERPAA